MLKLVYELNKSTIKKQDSTPSLLVNKRILLQPKHGHYALAPAQLALLNNLHSAGGKESKTININNVDKAPDTICEAKGVYSKEILWAIGQRLYSQEV